MASYLRGFQRGIGADMLGGPVDLTTELLNAGISGANLLGAKLPKIEKPVGGSDWFADRMMSSDDGTPQFLAGRLTPLAATLTNAAGGGAKRLVNALVSRSAPSRTGPTAMMRPQEGALYPGGRPDLIASHSTTAEGLGATLGRRGQTIELNAPSFAITKESVPTNFSKVEDSLQLIPKAGAFDPATSNTTLLNRDAYTPRWRQLQSRPVGLAAGSPDTSIFSAYDHNVEKAAKAVYKSDIPREQLIELATGKPISLEDYAYLVRLGAIAENAPKGYFKALGQAYAGMDVGDFSKNPNFQSDLQVFRDIWNAGDKWGIRGQKSNPREEAKKRLLDRLYSPAQGKDVIGRESIWTFDQSKAVNRPSFDGDVTGRLSQDLAIKGSPVFRSFQQYEQSPLGANLLLPPENAMFDYDKYEGDAVRKAFGSYIRHPDVMDDVSTPMAKNLLQYYIKKQDAGLKGDDLAESFFDSDLFRTLTRGDQQTIRDRWSGFEPAAQDLRRAYRQSPTQYAELKAHGPVPVTGENFAAAMLRTPVDSQAQERAVRALQQADVPVVDMSKYYTMPPRQLVEEGLIPSVSWGDMERFWFNRALEVQRWAGPARKTPLMGQ